MKEPLTWEKVIDFILTVLMVIALSFLFGMPNF
jgi:hypothetical protein